VGIAPERMPARAQMDRDELLGMLRAFRDKIDRDIAMLSNGGTDDIGTSYAGSVGRIFRRSALAEARLMEAIAYQEGLR
jgi:hypothetical protein